jgi:hypothetical protein
MPGLREVDRAYVLPGSREKTVGVPVAVNVEADELAVVVEAVDGGGPDAVGVVDQLEVRVMQGVGQDEAVHLARAVHVHTHDLIILVDAQGGCVGRAGEVELAEGLSFSRKLTTLPLEVVRKPIHKQSFQIFFQTFFGD